MKVAVVVFPGSNCDHDAYWSYRHLIGVETVFAWHKEADLHGADAVVLPGGFSYGDYLRCGAIASRSPVMRAVSEFARRGGPVIGICNGFQILCESGLLPGALLRNRDLRFLCRDVYLRCESNASPFTRRLERGQTIRAHIAHGEGNYFADEQTLARLEGDGRVAFRYVSPQGGDEPEWNVNGSARAIAGVLNEGKNVLGLMPHPERMDEAILGCTDGLAILEGVLGGRRAAAGAGA